MNKLSKNLLTILFGCFLMIPLANAEPYIGLQFGSANLDDAYDSANSGFIYAGYDMDNFAFEGGVAPLGFYQHKSTDSSIQVDGFEFDALGKLKINKRFTAFAKLGLHSYTLKPKFSGIPLTEIDGTTMTYGVGVMMDIGQTLKARVVYEIYDDIEGLDIDRIVIGIAAKVF